MGATENIIRLRMAEKDKSEWSDFLERHPEYKKKHNKSLENYEDMLIETYFRNEDEYKNASPKEKKIMDAVASASLDDFIKDICSRFSYKNLFEDYKSIFLESYLEKKKQFDNILDYAAEKKQIDLTKIKSSASTFMDYIRYADVIIESLSEIAVMGKGIESAMRDKTINNVIKKVFPTPESYKNTLTKDIEAKKITVDLIICSAKDEEAKKFMGTIYSLLAVYNEAKLNFIEEKKKKIYGDSGQNITALT